jgi:hypothetical protein
VYPGFGMVPKVWAIAQVRNDSNMMIEIGRHYLAHLDNQPNSNTQLDRERRACALGCVCVGLLSTLSAAYVDEAVELITQCGELVHDRSNEEHIIGLWCEKVIPMTMRGLPASEVSYCLQALEGLWTRTRACLQAVPKSSPLFTEIPKDHFINVSWEIRASYLANAMDICGSHAMGSEVDVEVLEKDARDCAKSITDAEVRNGLLGKIEKSRAARWQAQGKCGCSGSGN